MDGLPELPFEQVLSYLSLEDRLKARAVCRRWYHMIGKFKVRTLCYSERPLGFIRQKNRLVRGSFDRNFVSSNRFEWFFSRFGPTILSNLKHLRLCELDLMQIDAGTLAQTISSFDLLEQLVLFGTRGMLAKPADELELKLPMLTSVQLERVFGIEKLTLDAPRLRKVELRDGFVALELVHVESVERVVTDALAHMPAKNLKNLKYLYCGFFCIIDPTLIFGLEKLKEIHIFDLDAVKKFFEQKRRYNRADLKIYFCGRLLSCNSPDDLAMMLRGLSEEETFGFLVENPTEMADEMPFWERLFYSAVEHVAPRSDVLKRLTDLNEIHVSKPVQDIERFLNFLRHCDSIASLWFYCDQPQDLFDRLPDHCAVQKLEIRSVVSDFRFLLALKSLTHLTVHCLTDAEMIPQVFHELKFLLRFEFLSNNWNAQIETRLEPFRVSISKRKIYHFDKYNRRMEGTQAYRHRTYAEVNTALIKLLVRLRLT